MAGLSGLTGLSGESGIFGGAATYIDKVASYGPIAYWVLNETAGGTAADQINSPAQDGSYTACALANAIGPDGVNYAPLFDGANSVVNIYTAAFAGAFNGSEGTIALWARVLNVGVWTDSTVRFTYYLRVDGSNEIRGWYRDSTNNRLVSNYEAGGSNKLTTSDGHSETTWQHYALSWSKVADEVRQYINGSQVGATLGTLGIWAGALSNTDTVIGARNTTPNSVWSGWLAHVAVWSSALSPTDIADLATV